MKNLIWTLLIFPVMLWSQQEFHVFPSDHRSSPGLATGDGSIKHPWDLQTALDQLYDSVDGGDTIWLHEGIYSGRFISSLGSSNPNKKIIVNAFQNDKVVLNGNVASKRGSVLEVRGNYVSFRNIEITFIGEFSRKQGEGGFQVVSGLNHVSGVNCEFINLKIHNNPGSGFGSWKRTGGSLIYGCVIFNNGYYSTKRGSGVGMYIQNESDAERQIKNNIIFNNYYKGVEIWSASKNATSSYVKNVRLQNNVIFNNGLPAGIFRDNLIVATDSRNGLNIAKNIQILDNIFYHNTNIKGLQVNGNASSLTVGYFAKAPVENISVLNNVIIGRNNALRFNNAKSLTFKNNTVYAGYVHLNKSVLDNISTWNMDENRYFTKKRVPFRVIKEKDYQLSDWKSQHAVDSKSTWKHIKEFDMKPVLNLTRNEFDETKFKLVLFNKNAEDVTVDLSGYDIKKNQSYSLVDIETNEMIQSGNFTNSKSITMSIGMLNQTNANFGVFELRIQSEEEKKTSFLKRWLKWLF